MKKLLLASVALGAIAFSGSAFATVLTLGAGANPLGPEYLITFAANGGVSTALNPVYSGSGDPGPYDGVEDTYFGVINNSSNPISSINLSSALNIGGFEGDGITNYGIAGNGSDPSGYGGPNAYFTNNTGYTLTVNFITPIAANGGTDIFSLEEQTGLNNVVVVGAPEASTWAMMLLGFAGLGFAAFRKSGTKRVALAT